ncbi:MAG: magnesium/cobalt transporter CorA [Nitrococcus sp.]|nr:magnesium/cobalt transporter CorA [Nitrococcus sp.]
MLINCVVYQEGKKLRDIQISEISNYVKMPDCFVWVALRDAEPSELDRLQVEFQLHELAVEDAQHGHQRPKVEEYDGSLFVVIHTIELVDGEIHKGELNVFVGANYVLSVRNHSQRAFLNVRARCESEPQLLRLGSAFVLYALMDAVVDRYFPVAEELEMELETIEEQMLAQGTERSSIQRLYQLKRKATILKHAVAPLMEATGRLFGGRVPTPFGHTHDYFRDVYDHLQRINTSIDTIRETIATAIQVNLSMVAIDEAEVNKRLAAWAAIFAAATVLAGIWGMNFEFMPELKWKYGYAAALGVIATVCGYLYYRFRRAGWL